MLWRRVDAGWWKGINGHKLMPITVPCFSIGNIPLVFVRLVIALVPSGKQFHNLQAKQVSKGSQNIDRSNSHLYSLWRWHCFIMATRKPCGEIQNWFAVCFPSSRCLWECALDMAVCMWAAQGHLAYKSDIFWRRVPAFRTGRCFGSDAGCQVSLLIS